MAPKAESSSVPSKLIKELQRLVAIVVVKKLEKLHQQSSIQSQKQWDYCYTEYHGSVEADTIGLAEFLLQGKNQFHGAFDKTTVDVTDKDLTTNKERVLTPLLSRSHNMVLHVGKQLTTTLMSNVTKSTNSPKLSGRQILLLGNAAKTNILKATTFADVYSKNNNGCTNHSGHNALDMYHHVLKKMYTYETSQTPEEKMGENVGVVAEDEADENNDNNQSEKDQHEANSNKNKVGTNQKKRPEDWFFAGFMGFVLFLKYAQEQGSTLTILQSADLGKNVGVGCRDTRNVDKSVCDKSCSLQACRNGDGGADSPFKRGINMESRQQLAMLEQTERKLLQRDHENNVFILSQLITNQLATNEQRFCIAVRLGRDSQGNNDPQSPTWIAYFKGVEEVAAMQEELRNKKNSNETATKKKSPKRSLAVGFLNYVENPSSAKKWAWLSHPSSGSKHDDSPLTDITTISTKSSGALLSNADNNINRKRTATSVVVPTVASIVEQVSNSAEKPPGVDSSDSEESALPALTLL